jgi:DNA-damage-inducible protein J
MSAIVKAVIPPDLKAQAEAVLRQVGLDMTGAIRMFLSQVVMQQGLPFEAKIVTPNAATLRAIEDSRGGRTTKFASLDEMVADAAE